MDSKPRKTRKDKGVKRKAKGKGKAKKIARGAKKIFETDLLGSQRRRPAAPAQQQQPVFNLNIAQNLKNIVGAFASASTAANYAKTQEINRQAADASYRAETIVGLNRENFLASVEKQRLEKKVERGERAYASAVTQNQRRIQEIGDTMYNLFSGGGAAAAPPRRPARRAARVMEVVSMSDSDAPFEGFSDVPPSRQLSAEDLGILSRPISRVPSADVPSPMGVFTPRRSLQEIAADERALRGESEEDVPVLGRSGQAFGREFSGGGGSAYASEQYLQNQPRGRPVIADPATARTERVNRKIAKIIKVKEPKPREELLLARQDADAAIARAREKKLQERAASMTLEQIETNSVFAPAAAAGGGAGGAPVAAAAGGGGDVAGLVNIFGAPTAEAAKRFKLKLKPEAIARALALGEAQAAAAAAAGGGAAAPPKKRLERIDVSRMRFIPAPSTSSETESSSSSSSSAAGGAAAGRAATTPQRLRAAEIRSQLSAAAGVPQKSIKFATGKGSRKAVSGVDWVATIADIKKRGLTGAAAIEAIKQKHRDVLE